MNVLRNRSKLPMRKFKNLFGMRSIQPEGNSESAGEQAIRIHVTTRGRRYVRARELLRNSHAKEQIKKMAELTERLRSQNARQQSSD